MLLLMLALSYSDSPSGLAARVAVGHQALVGSIRTLSTTVNFSDAQDPYMGASGSFYLDVDKSSVHIDGPNRFRSRMLLMEDRVLQLTERWDGASKVGGVTQIATVVPASEDLGGLDVRKEFYFIFRADNKRYVSLSRMLNDNSIESSVVEEAVDGLPLVKVMYRYRLTEAATTRVCLWLDPSRSYSVVRAELMPDDGSGDVTRVELSEFVVSGGVQLPTRATTTGPARSNGQPRIVQTVKLSNIKVNEPLPANVFDLRLPAGTQVRDVVRNSKYVAGPDWKPVGPETPWSRVTFAAPAAPDGSATGQPTTTEPRGWTWWLVAASGAVLTLGGVATLVRRAVRGRGDAAA